MSDSLYLKTLREDFGNPPLVIRTDIMTPEGVMVIVEFKDGDRPCLVWGHTMDVALRKVISYFEDKEENKGKV